MTSNPVLDLSEVSDSELLVYAAELDVLFVEAYGDHPALAEVRRQIVGRMDECSVEIAKRVGLVDPWADDDDS